ncbi:hypothetical protein EU527_07050 [Candidatus Thorarchaeota archaeon]|nr:MAG: hypothetical protein EU527_07050 [Candidatus Thorarchaeota archaeon]
MSDEERSPSEGPDPADIESETSRLIEQAMTTSSIKPDEEDEITSQSTTVQVDITFQRIQNRILDLLGSIEDALKSVEPNILERVAGIMENVAKQLNSAGLGVFASRAINLVRDEVEGGFAVEDLFSPVYENLEKSRVSVEDIMTKAGRGAVKNIGHSTGGLQARLVQMYANMNEMEKRLEASRAELRKWRGRVIELEERIRQREELMDNSKDALDRLHNQLDDLKKQLSERDAIITTLTGEVNQAQSQLEQQRESMANMGSMEKIAVDFDAKIVELSELKGQLAQYIQLLEQKDIEIAQLHNTIGQIRKEKDDIENVLESSANEMVTLRGAKQNYDIEITELKTQVTELKTRWDALYSIAEDEPAFKAYFLVADKTQWFQLSHLSSALGIPTVLLKRQIQKFIDAGLLEMDGERVRARSLSDLAREAEGIEAQMIEDARAELGDEKIESDKPFDPKDLVMPTPEYTGPEDGDYEQEGR